MATMLDELKAKLVTAGIVTTAETFLDRMPPDPDDAIALMAGPGVPPVRVMKQLPDHFRPSLQVLVRRGGVGARAAAELKSREILNNLQGFTGVLGSPATGRYLDIAVTGSPASIGRDENERDVFSTFYYVSREPL